MTADTQDLLRLADEVAAATGADRRLDAAIASACRHALPKGGEWALKFPNWEAAPNSSGEVRIIGNVNGNGDYIAGKFCSPAYTASLDAAMTLVPEGLRMMLSEWDDEQHLRPMGPWQAVLSKPDCDVSFDAMRGFRCDHAATPALALASAALKARAHSTKDTSSHD